MKRQLKIIPDTAEERVFQAATDLGFNKDVAKAKNGNKSAARRVRKVLRQIELECKQARVEMLNIIMSKHI